MRRLLAVESPRLEPVDGLVGPQVAGEIEVGEHVPAGRVDAVERRACAARLDRDERRPRRGPRLVPDPLGELGDRRRLDERREGELLAELLVDLPS